MTSPADRADEYWAAVFKVEPPSLRQPGLHVTYVDDPHAGIYVLELGETVRVRAPMHRRDEVGAVRIESALDRDAWQATLRSSGSVVLGPAVHYVASDAVGSIYESAHPTIADVLRITETIPAEEVAESGVLEPDIDWFGLWRDDTLAAVSSLSTWVGGRTDVGLLVAPEFRGQGLGREVAAIALNAATRRAGIARWRCREDNTASVALAVGFGLQRYARNLGIRL